MGLFGIKYTDEEKGFLKHLKETSGFPEPECKELLNKCIKLAKKCGMRGVSNFGDIKIKEKEAFEKKSKAGLSREDFLKYWNRPWVWIAVEAELANLIRFTTYNNICENEGLSAKKAINEVRKIFIYYGDPENSPPDYQGQDADIYPEFQIRYENWRVQYAPMEEQEMMTKYSTCNAMVRDLITKGKL